MRKLIALVVVAAAGLALATVPTTSSRVDATGDGATATFTFTFPVTTSSSHVEVFLAGVKQVAGYTVALNANQASAPGGSVTFTPAPAAGIAVRIQRTIPLTQDTVYTPYSAFPAKTTEKALDRGVEVAQQLDRRISDVDATYAASIASTVAAQAAQRTSDLAAQAAQRTSDLAAQAARDSGQDAALSSHASAQTAQRTSDLAAQATRDSGQDSRIDAFAAGTGFVLKTGDAMTGPLTAPSFVGTVTGPVIGNASTASALLANPAGCSANQYATAIAANGNLTCSQVTGAQVSGAVASATSATALASNGANCSSGQAALGVDASGNAEGCWTVPASTTRGSLNGGTSNSSTTPVDITGLSWVVAAGQSIRFSCTLNAQYVSASNIPRFNVNATGVGFFGFSAQFNYFTTTGAMVTTFVTATSNAPQTAACTSGCFNSGTGYPVHIEGMGWNSSGGSTTVALQLASSTAGLTAGVWGAGCTAVIQ